MLDPHLFSRSLADDRVSAVARRVSLTVGLPHGFSRGAFTHFGGLTGALPRHGSGSMAAIGTHGAAANPLEALVSDQRHHGQRGYRIGPPPAKERIEEQPAKEDR